MQIFPKGVYPLYARTGDRGGEFDKHLNEYVENEELERCGEIRRGK